MKYSTELLAAVCIASNAITAVQAADCTQEQAYAAIGGGPFASAFNEAKQLNYTASVAESCGTCTTPCIVAEKAFLDSMKSIVAKLATAKPTCTLTGTYAVYDSYFTSPDAYTMMTDGDNSKFADLITTMHKQCPYPGDGYEIVGNICTIEDIQNALSPFVPSFGFLAASYPSVGTACSGACNTACSDAERDFLASVDAYFAKVTPPTCTVAGASASVYDMYWDKDKFMNMPQFGQGSEFKPSIKATIDGYKCPPSSPGAVGPVNTGPCTTAEMNKWISSGGLPMAMGKLSALNKDAMVAACATCTDACKAAEKALLNDIKAVADAFVAAKPSCQLSGDYAVYSMYMQVPGIYGINSGDVSKGGWILRDVMNSMHAKCPFPGDGADMLAVGGGVSSAGRVCMAADIAPLMSLMGPGMMEAGTTKDEVVAACGMVDKDDGQMLYPATCSDACKASWKKNKPLLVAAFNKAGEALPPADKFCTITDATSADMVTVMKAPADQVSKMILFFTADGRAKMPEALLGVEKFCGIGNNGGGRAEITLASLTMVLLAAVTLF